MTKHGFVTTIQKQKSFNIRKFKSEIYYINTLNENSAFSNKC